MLHAFASALEKLGIKAEIIETEPVNYRTKIYNFDYDLMVDYFPFRNIIGSEQLNYWHSKTADAHGSRNYAGVKNPAIDMLTKRLSNTQDINELVTTAHVLDRMLLFGYYMIPFWRPKDIRFAHWDSIEAPKKSPRYEIDLESWWTTEHNNFDKAPSKKIK